MTEIHVEQRFRNRLNELSFLRNEGKGLETGVPKFLMWCAEDSYGATAFLKEAHRQNARAFFSIFLDCSKKSLDGFLQETVFALQDQRPSLAKQVQNEISRIGAPKPSKKVSTATVVAIPYIGRSIKELTESPKNQITAGYRIQERPNTVLKAIAQKLHGERLIVFIDNYHELDADQREYINSLIFYSSKSKILIVALAKQRKSLRKNIIQLREAGFTVKSKQLKPLEIDVLRDIGNDRGVQLAEDELQALKNRNIYDFLEHVYGLEARDPLDDWFAALSPLSRYLLGAISICDQPITLDFLTNVALKSSTVYAGEEQSVLSEIERLIGEDIIEKRDFYTHSVLKISADIRPHIKRKISLAEAIVYTNEVYKELVENSNLYMDWERFADFFFAFSLSLSVDPERSSEWAHRLLTLSLANRSHYDVLNFIKANLKPNSSYTSFMLCLGAAMQRKDYEFFNRVFDDAEYSFQTRLEAMVFRAIYFTRTRQYSLSAELIKACRGVDHKKRFTSLLRCYEIINFYHIGNKREALQVYMGEKPTDGDGSIERYLHRIGAGLVEPESGMKLLESVIIDFEQSGDRFGELTTRSNLGVMRCRVGLLTSGIATLEEAYSALDAFGPENITHCALSLAAAYIEVERFTRARDILKRLVRIPEDPHYLLVAQSLLAQIDILEGNYKAGLGTYSRLDSAVQRTPTYNLKSLFFINHSLAKAVNGEYDAEFESSMSNALKFPAGNQSKKWSSALDVIMEAKALNVALCVEKFKQFSLRGYFEYWWFDPSVYLIGRSD